MNHGRVRSLHARDIAFVDAAEQLVRIRRILRELRIEPPGVHEVDLSDISTRLEMAESYLIGELARDTRGQE